MQQTPDQIKKKRLRAAEGALFILGLGLLGLWLFANYTQNRKQTVICQKVSLPGVPGPARLCLHAAPAADNKDLFSYQLDLSQGGTVSGAEIPGGPFTKASRGQAAVDLYGINPGEAVAGLVFYSGVPAFPGSDDGHAVFYALKDGRLVFLNELGFPSLRPEIDGKRKEAAAELKAEDRDGDGNNEIVVAIRTEIVTRTASGSEKKEVEEEEYHYKLLQGRLIKVGYQKPRPPGAPPPLGLP